MFKFGSGSVVAVAIGIAVAMIDGVWVAQLLLFAAGFATAGIWMMEESK